jgi:methionyl-tRNA formyltransferase
VSNLKIIFLGTPQFAIPSLQSLLEAGYQIPLIICQPDRPVGRGQRIIPCPVKDFALKHNLQVRQPLKLREDSELISELKDIQPDLMVTAAFGQIISQEIIDIPKWGIWNVHASLLPRWRGAAPINWALLAGDHETGVTIMQTEKGLDTGPMLTKKAIKISPEDDAQTLTERLSVVGAKLLLKTIEDNLKESFLMTPQDEALVTHAPKVGKHLSPINWNKMSAEEIDRRVRALKPWPGVCFELSDGTVIKLLKAQPAPSQVLNCDPGKIVEITTKEIIVACLNGALKITEVQPPNKPKMNAADWFRGLKLETGEKLN